MGTRYNDNLNNSPIEDDEPVSEPTERPGEFDFDEDDLDLGDDFIASALAALENVKDIPVPGQEHPAENSSDIEEFEIVMDDTDLLSVETVPVADNREVQRLHKELEAARQRVDHLDKELVRIKKKSKGSINDLNGRLKEAARMNKGLKERLDIARGERDAAREEAQEHEIKWTEAVAEYQNIQRRSRVKMAEFVDLEKRNVIKNYLPVYDNMRRSLEFTSEPSQAFLDGVQLILKQFRDVLENQDVKEIPAMGEPFDPYCHEAVGRMPDDSVPNNTVVEVMQTGYYIGDKVLRVAKVTVSYCDRKDSNISGNSVESEKIALDSSDDQSEIESDSEGVEEHFDNGENGKHRQGGSTE